MKKILISILIFLLIFSANAEIILSPEEIEDEDLLEYIEEDLDTNNTEIIYSDNILITEIATVHAKYIMVDYTCYQNYITFCATPIGFENIDYYLQWEYSTDGITFKPILYETDDTFTLNVNNTTINWYVRATAIFDAY